MRKILMASLMACITLISISCGNNNTTGTDTSKEESENITSENQGLPESTLDNEQFKVKDNVIFSENLPVVVDFYADWCGPCKAYSPTFQSVAAKYEGSAVFVSINVDDYPELAAAYNADAIPATAFICTGGSTLAVEKGVLTEQKLSALVDQLIATNAGESMEL